MSGDLAYDHEPNDYARSRKFGTTSGPEQEKPTKPVLGRRRAKSPQSVNGIHRRRRRKMGW